MNAGSYIRRLAAVAGIALIAATGCSTSKQAATTPPSQNVPATSSSAPAVTGQTIDLTGLDGGLKQIDTEVSGANAGLNSTSEGDVQTR